MPEDILISNQPVCLADFEKYAEMYLPRRSFEYFSDGTGENQTFNDNQEAFRRLRLRPRLLRNVSKLDTSTIILGSRISSPIGVCPTALHSLIHADGEMATAKGAERADVCFIQSTFSNFSYKDVSTAAPDCLKWVNVYIMKERSETQQMIERAEKLGYKAVVVTVDSPVIQTKRVFQRSNFEECYQVLKSRGHPNFDYQKMLLKYPANPFSVEEISWTDVDWLRSITKLPIILKGILTSEDALLAVKHGASGIIVSNHGGRQLDGVPASVDALPEVVKAVDGKIEVYLDGGIRQGTDVLKAVALGAKAVFVGRPVLWGLAYEGDEGVLKVLNILQEELRTAMALSGCSTISDIASMPNLVVRENFFLSKL